MFSLLRNHQIVFQSGYITFFTSTSFSCSTSSPTLAWYCDSLILSFQIGGKFYLVMVFICISLMTNDVKHLYLWMLAICMSLRSPFFVLWILFHFTLLIPLPYLFEDINNTFIKVFPIDCFLKKNFPLCVLLLLY